MSSTLARNLEVTSDLPAEAMRWADRCGVAALDIETSGLDWKTDEIGTFQVFFPSYEVYLVRVNGRRCPQLETFLERRDVLKIFHHAVFDLRFIAAKWGIHVANVACTKIASKILDLDRSVEHSLKDLVDRHLDTRIDKSQRLSDWFAEELTLEQLEYSARDVIYLPRLFEELKKKLLNAGRWSLAEASFEYVPIRVQLDLLGCGDVFHY